MQVSWDFSIVDLAVILSVLLVFVFWVLAKMYWQKFKSPVYVDRKFIKKRWREIEQLFRYKKEMNYKLAIIEADKLFDHVLKEMHFQGETMAQRLKMATYKYPKLKNIWWGHKMRNHIVHDAKYTCRYGETKKVLGNYKRAFRDLNVL
jgi:hypothetical protein